MSNDKDWSDTYQLGYLHAIHDALELFEKDPSKFVDELKYMRVVVPESVTYMLDIQPDID